VGHVARRKFQAAALLIFGATVEIKSSMICSPKSTTFAPAPATNVTLVMPMTPRRLGPALQSSEGEVLAGSIVSGSRLAAAVTVSERS
jgi:hypothetical protein